MDENKLQFQMQPQLAALWCWAAVARSVFHFYDTRANPEENSQCSIATELLDQPLPCCPNPFGGVCEKQLQLEVALKHVEKYRRRKPGPIIWETLVKEIDAGKVVCAFIRWSDDSGHFISITGYTGNLNGPQSVFVDDSLGGERHMTFDDLRLNYENREASGGKWEHTYFTEP